MSPPKKVPPPLPSSAPHREGSHAQHPSFESHHHTAPSVSFSDSSTGYEEPSQSYHYSTDPSTSYHQGTDSGYGQQQYETTTQPSPSQPPVRPTSVVHDLGYLPEPDGSSNPYLRGEVNSGRFNLYEDYDEPMPEFQVSPHFLLSLLSFFLPLFCVATVEKSYDTWLARFDPSDG